MNPLRALSVAVVACGLACGARAMQLINREVERTTTRAASRERLGVALQWMAGFEIAIVASIGLINIRSLVTTGIPLIGVAAGLAGIGAWMKRQGEPVWHEDARVEEEGYWRRIREGDKEPW